MAIVTFIRYQKQSAGALRGVAGYVSQAEKTMGEDGLQLLSGQNCTPELAAQEFLATRQMYRKNSPVWFYHYVQSFHPEEEITGTQAHRLAQTFARRAWPDSEVLIATHLDAGHIHSHFLVNAVCCQSGKMLRQGPSTLHTLRECSDRLCMEYGLSVLPKGRSNAKGMTAREYRSAAKGESWKFRLMYAIDHCMRYARTKEEFIDRMEAMGYGVSWTDSRKYITYTTPQGMKCRDNRLHHEGYTKSAMEQEFALRSTYLRSYGWGGELAGELVQLGRELERNQEPEPITDATTLYQYTDRKVLLREQEKRMALGHRQDDHQEVHKWEQTM